MATSKVSIVILLPEDKRQYAHLLPANVSVIYYQFKTSTLLKKIIFKCKNIVRKNNQINQLILNTNADSLTLVKAIYLPAWMKLPPIEYQNLFDKLPNLQWVYSQRSGIDHLPIELLKDKKIQVSNTGNLVTKWVAQMNLTCILAQSKKLPKHILAELYFNKSPHFSLDLNKLTVAILGTGNIGNETARLCKNVGMNVIGITQNSNSKPEKQNYNSIYEGYKGLATILEKIDFLVLAVPLNTETKASIDIKIFNKMKNSACIINLARPAIIQETDLICCLKAKSLAAAYLPSIHNISIVDRFILTLKGMLIITHSSDAHIKEKDSFAFNQFIVNIRLLNENKEINNRVI